MCPSPTGLSRGTRPRSTSRCARPWNSGRCAGSIGCPIGLNLLSHRTRRLHGPATPGQTVTTALGLGKFAATSSGYFERCDTSHCYSPYGADGCGITSERINPRRAGTILGAEDALTRQPGLSTDTITVPAEMRRGRPA